MTADPAIVAARLRPAVEAFLLAKAYHATWVDRVRPVQVQALRDVGATYDNSRAGGARNPGAPITDPRHSYLMSDEKAVKYFDLLHDEYRLRGWL